MKDFKIVIFLIILLFSQENRVNAKKGKNNKAQVKKIKNKTPKNLQETLEIANYVYPKLSEDKSKYIIVPIVGTSDIHGHLIESNFTDSNTNKTFSQGAAAHFAEYIEILKYEWEGRLVYLDCGDIYQGAYESKVSNGDIMIEFQKYMNVRAETIGNHDFDFGEDYLDNKLSTLSGLFVSTNVFQKEKEENEEQLENTVKTKIIDVPNTSIKIGIIGITTIDTYITSGGDLSYVTISDAFQRIITDHAKELREQGVNAVVLIAHSGLECQNKDSINKESLKIVNSQSENQCIPEGELSNIVNSLSEGTVDLVLGGHLHENYALFSKGFPIMAPKNNLEYFNIAYLYFDATTNNLVKDQIQLEGPVPVCSHVYSNYRRCGDFTDKENENLGELKEFTFHGQLIRRNENLLDALGAYISQVNEASNTKLFTLEGNEKTYGREKEKESFLCNLASDIMREKVDADFAIMNNGFFRTTWQTGDISVKDFYDMFPFDNNYLSLVTLNGADLKAIFEGIQLQTNENAKGIYGFSGATVNYDVVNHIVKKFTFINGNELDLQKNYTLATNSFLLPGYGDDFTNLQGKINPSEANLYGDIPSIIKDYLILKQKIKVSDYYEPENNPRLIISNGTNGTNITNDTNSSNESSSDSKNQTNDERHYTIILNQSSNIKTSYFLISFIFLIVF